MPKYQIHYSFTGSGRVTLEADTEDAARAKFDHGDWGSHDIEEDYHDHKALRIEPTEF
jgi:hypothetical protein